MKCGIVTFSPADSGGLRGGRAGIGGGADSRCGAWGSGGDGAPGLWGPSRITMRRLGVPAGTEHRGALGMGCCWVISLWVGPDDLESGLLKVTVRRKWSALSGLKSCGEGFKRGWGACERG